jgi:hypothetical protein
MLSTWLNFMFMPRNFYLAPDRSVEVPARRVERSNNRQRPCSEARRSMRSCLGIGDGGRRQQ